MYALCDVYHMLIYMCGETKSIAIFRGKKHYYDIIRTTEI